MWRLFGKWQIMSDSIVSLPLSLPSRSLRNRVEGGSPHLGQQPQLPTDWLTDNSLAWHAMINICIIQSYDSPREFKCSTTTIDRVNSRPRICNFNERIVVVVDEEEEAAAAQSGFPHPPAICSCHFRMRIEQHTNCFRFNPNPQAKNTTRLLDWAGLGEEQLSTGQELNANRLHSLGTVAALLLLILYLVSTAPSHLRIVCNTTTFYPQRSWL